MTVYQIFKKAFFPLIKSLQIPTKEYVVTLNPVTGAQAKYTIVDQTVDISTQSTVSSTPDASWIGNPKLNLGVGKKDQFFDSADGVWRYTCVADNFWSRSLLISYLTNIDLGVIDDTLGVIPISQLNTLYPNAQPYQVLRGISARYQRTVGNSWDWWFVNGNTAPRAKAITANYTLSATDHGSVISVNSSSDITIMVPIMPPGFKCVVIQVGSGKFSFSLSGSGMGIFAWPKTGNVGSGSQWDTIDVVTPNGTQFILK